MENVDKFLFEGQESLSHACLFVHTSLKVFSSCLWYLDSGCYRYMTRDKSLFKYLKGKVGDYVTFGDGSHAQVPGKGNVEIPSSIERCFIHQRVEDESLKHHSNM